MKKFERPRDFQPVFICYILQATIRSNRNAFLTVTEPERRMTDSCIP